MPAPARHRNAVAVIGQGAIQVVSKLEGQTVSLEESIALWERGEELAKICEEWLSGARKKLDAAQSKREAK